MFVAGSPDNPGLWKTDGTADGTHLVKQLPGVPREMLTVNDTLFLGIGTLLWGSDGTAEGTRELADVQSRHNVITNLTQVGDRLFFAAPWLYTSDGTPEGTRQVKDVAASNLINVAGTLFFAGADVNDSSPYNGFELWKSDGTEAGTLEVKDIAPGEDWRGSARSSEPQNLTDFNGTLYFLVRRGNLDESSLWSSDGTEEGTINFANSSIFARPFVFQDQLFVQDGHVIGSHSGNQSLGLWEEARPRDLLVADDAFFFTAEGELTGRELWKSDGTAAGTMRVVDLAPGNEWGVPNGELFHWKGSVYFAGNDGVSGLELWRTDGTANGTELIYDHVKPNDSPVRQLTVVDATLFFTADDGVNPGDQLWKADEDGAALVANLTSQYPNDSDLINFISFKNELIFTHQYLYWPGASRWYYGYDLLKSDGTGAQYLAGYFSWSTTETFDPGPSYQAVLGDRLYFEPGWYNGLDVELLPDRDCLGCDEIIDNAPSHFMRVGDQLFFPVVMDTAVNCG